MKSPNTIMDSNPTLNTRSSGESRVKLTLARRSFFGQVAGGIYGAALASLLGRDLYGDETAHAFQPADI